MLDAQRLCAVLGNSQQTINVRVLARVSACIGRVLGKYFQALLGGIDINRAPDLRQVVIHRQRTLATGFVLDDTGEVALAITQFDGGQM